jgi:hypothetical protein
MSTHPSDLALEQHLMSPEGSVVAPHLDGCGACRDRLGQMQRVGDEFRAFVYPATVGKVMEAAAPSRRRWLPVFVPVAVAAAAGLFVVFMPPVPPDGYTGAKGGGLGLSVFVADGPSSARALEDGEVVSASAALRFKVRPVKPCQLWVVSLDSTGQVSRIYPPSGVAGGSLRESAALPGGAVLDGHAGPERLFAICSREALDFDTLARAVRSASGAASEDAVRKTQQLVGLPPGTDQATLLLEKKP